MKLFLSCHSIGRPYRLAISTFIASAPPPIFLDHQEGITLEQRRAGSDTNERSERKKWQIHHQGAKDAKDTKKCIDIGFRFSSRYPRCGYARQREIWCPLGIACGDTRGEMITGVLVVIFILLNANPYERLRRSRRWRDIAGNVTPSLLLMTFASVRCGERDAVSSRRLRVGEACGHARRAAVPHGRSPRAFHPRAGPAMRGSARFRRGATTTANGSWNSSAGAPPHEARAEWLVRSAA